MAKLEELIADIKSTYNGNPWHGPSIVNVLKSLKILSVLGVMFCVYVCFSGPRYVYIFPDNFQPLFIDFATQFQCYGRCEHTFITA